MSLRQADDDEKQATLDLTNQIMKGFMASNADPSQAQAACLLAYAMIGATLHCPIDELADNAATAIRKNTSFLNMVAEKSPFDKKGNRRDCDA